MVEYEIEGVKVEFPHEAYPCQLKYMEKVIACLNRGWNGVLESPTGTGKTLCLLCACLAWQQDQKRRKLDEAAGNLLQPTSSLSISNTNSKDGPVMLDRRGKVATNSTNQCVTYPRILYTSRTHMQLSQVIRELNKTSYKHVRTCLMGSRDQLCINEEVKKEENSTLKNHMCRAKIKTRTCRFYNGFEAYQNESLDPRPKIDEKTSTATKASSTSSNATKVPTSALDIEDFISYGRRNRMCPFFLSRDKPDEADLILLPYNYVVDVKARKANKIDLANMILIFDEAHNLEKVCEDSASFTFTSKDIAGSLREAQEALRTIMIDEEATRREMDETKLAFGAAQPPDDNIPQIKIDVKELADLIMLLQSFEKELDQIALTKLKNGRSMMDLPGKMYSGEFLLDLMEKAGIHALMRDGICALIDKTISYLTEKATNSVWQSRGATLQRFSSLLNTIFSGENDSETCEADGYRKHCRQFKVYVSHTEENRSGNFLLHPTKRQSIQLNYWCFNAGLTMQSLQRKGVHSILVTSGTLSPIAVFQTEMKIPFELTLQNDHVISLNQSWLGVVCRGPDDCTLDASYQNRGNESYLASLGNTLVNVFRIVPEGALIFFASYSQMNSCIEKWQKSDIWTRMGKHKALYVEPKSKDEFYRTINEYNAVVKSRPAAFFAICRGKVSEGIDFADSAARVVVMAGIPWPPMYDPRVVLKKDYLGEQQKERLASGQTAGSFIDGETWYRVEAIRAINQSIGRVIRHKDDYGAVVLADQRFSEWNADRLPSWIVPNRRVYAKFGEFSKSLTQFFKERAPKIERQSSFTEMRSKELVGFEKNDSIRKRPTDDSKRAADDSSHSKKSKNETAPDYFGVVRKETRPSPMVKPKPIYENMWDALEHGEYRVNKEDDSFVPYNPDNANRPKSPERPVQKRPKIKIKRDEDGPATMKTTKTSGDANEQAPLVKKEPIVVQHSQFVLDFGALSKRVLNADQYRQLKIVCAQYKADRQFEHVLTFLKGLPSSSECSELFKAFTQFVRAEHKARYSTFLKERV